MKLSQLIKRGLDLRAHRACAAIVPAAGSSTRMGVENKLLLDLCGMPVLARTLLALESCPHISCIIVVTREDEIPRMSELLDRYGISKALPPVVGGASRCESVYLGLAALPSGVTHVAVHDGARPLVSQDLLDRVLLRGMETGAAAPGLPVKDTVKEVSKGLVVRTVPRESLVAVQTPQVFDVDLLKAALQNAVQGDSAAVTDDCSAVEAMGMNVSIVSGEGRNLKITTPEDMIFARALLAQDEKRTQKKEMRV